MNPQEIQEHEYHFPYHYIAHFERGFRQCKTDTWGINYVSTIEFLLERLSLIEFSTIVDIGCGDGRLAREVALRYPTARTTGIDYSERAINLARAMNYGISSLHFSACDIGKMSATDKHDVALLIEVFEHIPPDMGEAFLDDVHCLLKTGGLLFVTVPHVNSKLDPKHYRHFTTESIRGLLEQKYEILEAVPFERISFMRKVLRLILSNPLFILNNQWALDRLYTLYKSHLFKCASESECQRLFVLAKAK